MIELVLACSAALATFLLIRGLRSRAPRSAWQAALRPHAVGDVRPSRPHLRPRTVLLRLRAPGAALDPARRLIDRAGAGERLTPQGVLVLSVSAAFAGPLGVLALLRGHELGARALALAVVVGLVGMAAPWIMLNGRASRRRQEIEHALPDMLDLLIVSIEAGLALEAALARVAQRESNALQQELRRTLSEVGLGRRRREALAALAARTGAPAVRSLVNALNQAERTGMRLGPLLRAQSEELRQRRRQRAEEAAMKAPLKMLFPLVMFIFPAVFTVVIGPAAISALQVLGGH
ncbi:MAG: type II secretion system F family protein [Dehalococcoidia bacterium]